MTDIHHNMLKVGDRVYALTTIHAGSQAKRLSYSEVIEIGRYIRVKCFETGREVNLGSNSVVKPLDN